MTGNTKTKDYSFFILCRVALFWNICIDKWVLDHSRFMEVFNKYFGRNGFLNGADFLRGSLLLFSSSLKRRQKICHIRYFVYSSWNMHQFHTFKIRSQFFDCRAIRGHRFMSHSFIACWTARSESPRTGRRVMPTFKVYIDESFILCCILGCCEEYLQDILNPSKYIVQLSNCWEGGPWALVHSVTNLAKNACISFLFSNSNSM